MKIQLWLGTAAAMFIAACATVPKDAPQVFHDAKKSIDVLDERNVGTYLPKSVARANASFEDALEMLDDVEDGEPLASEEAAINYAEQAKETANGALQIYDHIVLWDNDQDAFRTTMNAERASNVVTAIRRVSPFAALKGQEIVSTVAFFDFNNADSPEYINDEIDSLASILEKDSRFKVELTGYADPIGDSEYNQYLAMQRAKTVAANLRERGISDDQITIKSGGATGSASARPGKLQLQRRVQGVIVFE